MSGAETTSDQETGQGPSANMLVAVPSTLGYPVALTHHAVKRMTHREVRYDEVAEALLRPEQTYVDKGRDGRDRVVLQWEDIAVAVDPSAVQSLRFSTGPTPGGRRRTDARRAGS